MRPTDFWPDIITPFDGADHLLIRWHMHSQAVHNMVNDWTDLLVLCWQCASVGPDGSTFQALDMLESICCHSMVVFFKVAMLKFTRTKQVICSFNNCASCILECFVFQKSSLSNIFAHRLVNWNVLLWWWQALKCSLQYASVIASLTTRSKCSFLLLKSQHDGKRIRCVLCFSNAVNPISKAGQTAEHIHSDLLFNYLNFVQTYTVQASTKNTT